ncbi:15514_t:CDS:1, partial [Funneliformis caledonium]
RLERITVNDFVLGSTPSNGYLWSPRPGAPRALSPWSSPWIDHAPGISTGLPRHGICSSSLPVLTFPWCLRPVEDGSLPLYPTRGSFSKQWPFYSNPSFANFFTSVIPT